MRFRVRVRWFRVRVRWLVLGPWGPRPLGEPLGPAVKNMRFREALQGLPTIP